MSELPIFESKVTPEPLATLLTAERKAGFAEGVKAGRDEVLRELSEQPAVWYMYRDSFGYWRNFNEAEASLMVKRGDRWAAFDKMIRRPTFPTKGLLL